MHKKENGGKQKATNLNNSTLTEKLPLLSSKTIIAHSKKVCIFAAISIIYTFSGCLVKAWVMVWIKRKAKQYK